MTSKDKLMDLLKDVTDQAMRLKIIEAYCLGMDRIKELIKNE